MRIILICLALLVLGFSSSLSANDAAEDKISELSKKIEALTIELNELSATLQEAVKQDEAAAIPEEAAETDEAVAGDEPAKQSNIEELISAIEKLAQKQEVLTSEVEDLKSTQDIVETQEEIEQEVYVGEDVISDDGTGVLYQYGNANEYTESDRVYIEEVSEPVYIIEPERRSNVGVRFYFGTGGGRYYRDRWDGPWAVDPPWWVRKNYYRRHHH